MSAREFSPPTSARLRALATAAAVGAIGVVFAWLPVSGQIPWFGPAIPLLTLTGVAGLAFIAAAWSMGVEGLAVVRMDDVGLTVRRPWTPRIPHRIAWTSVARITFRAAYDAERHGLFAAHNAAALVAMAIDERRDGDWSPGRGGADPHHDENLRRKYQPSASLADARGRRIAYFSGTFGWDFFVALRDGATARGIEVVSKKGAAWPFLRD